MHAAIATEAAWHGRAAVRRLSASGLHEALCDGWRLSLSQAWVSVSARSRRLTGRRSRSSEELARNSPLPLRVFINSGPGEAERAWWNIENVVFSQDTIYGAAEPTVEVLLAALVDERPPLVRGWILEALFFLLKGGSQEDPLLPERCRTRARLGVWLLAREARIASGAERELILTLVSSLEPQLTPVIRAALRDADAGDGHPPLEPPKRW